MQLAGMCVLVSQVAGNLWKCPGVSMYTTKNIFRTKLAYCWALKYRTVTGDHEYKADLKILMNNPVQTQSDLLGEVQCFVPKFVESFSNNFTVEPCLMTCE